MKALIPYINFNGRCHQALAFYKSCFGAADLAISTFADMPDDEGKADDKDKVMHAEFKTDGLFFMATDGQSSETVTTYI